MPAAPKPRKKKGPNVGCKKFNRPKLRSRKAVKRDLIREFNKFIRERDILAFGGMCPFCPLKGEPQSPIDNCCHWQTSAWEATKWDEANATGGCASCNIRMEGDKDFMAKCVEWYKKMYGTDQWDAMVLRSHTPPNFSVFDLMSMLELYRHKNKLQLWEPRPVKSLDIPIPKPSQISPSIGEGAP